MSLRRGTAFWLMGGLLGTLMIAAGAPSPLYGVYQATWHFSAVTLTAVFAVYAVALLAAFLVAGRLSDHLGRKPVIIVALLIEAAALAIAEPGQRGPGALASLRPSVGVPRPARRAFAAGVPALAAGWALGGLYLALGPSLAAELLHSTNPVAGGAVIFLLTGVGAITSIVCRGWNPPTAMGVGCLLLAVGVGGTVAAVAAGSAAGFFAGTAFAGTGFGLAFLGVFRTLVALAPPAGRAGLITAIYIVSYLAFSLPVIAAGIAATHVGLRSTAEVYGLAVAALDVLAAAGLAVGIRRAHAAQGGTAAADQAPLPSGACCAPIDPGGA